LRFLLEITASLKTVTREWSPPDRNTRCLYGVSSSLE